MGVKRWWKVAGLGLLGALTGMLTLAVPQALASEFTKVGEFGPFAPESPRSVAVDAATGDVYVLNNGEDRVEKFGAAGEALGESFEGGFSEGVVGLAVDNSASVHKGDVYVADREHDRVDEFNAKGEAVGQIEVSGEPDAVAVDSSGDVYVPSEGEKVVRIFTPEGEPSGEIAGGDMTDPFGVAVSPNGTVYVVNGEDNVVKVRLNAQHQVQSETIMDAGEEPTAVAVEPATGDVFIANRSGEAQVVVFGAADKQEAAFGVGQMGFARGIAFSTSNGDLYVADKPNMRVDIFEGEVPPPPPPLPIPVTGPASGVQRTSVTLTGTVNPEGVEANFDFEYGPCASPSACAASAFPSKTTEGVVGSGKETTPVPVEAHLVGELTPGTTYHVRLAAHNGGGAEAGEEVLFMTPPAVSGVSACVGHETGAGSLVGATLEGSLEPEGEQAEYYFEYGPMALTAPPTESVLTLSSGIQQAYAEVTGLEPNATYDCRLTAARDLGGILYQAHGEQGTFATRAVAPAVEDQPPSASAITRKTAVLNATVNPEHSATTYHFLYVAAASYEPAAKNPYYAGASTPDAAAGAGFGEEPVSAQLAGLHAATTYDYAIVAENEDTKPTVVVGQNHQFTTSAATPPVIAAGETSVVTPTSVVISDAIDSEGLPTTYEVQFGGSPGGGGAGTFGQLVPGHETITLAFENLTPSTTYYYTVLATNEDGTTSGPVDQTFTTPTVGVASPIVQPLAPPLLATPPIAFPTETGVITTTPKTLTRAQKLKAALKACRTKDKHSKARRQKCERRARRKYGPVGKRGRK